MSFEERLSGSQAPALYALSLLIVFLCLAALYESWSIPFSVMLVVPLGVPGLSVLLCCAALVTMSFPVGLLTTIGLSAKMPYLSWSLLVNCEKEGLSIKEAAVEAARVRLRPIIMTSLAFVMGLSHWLSLTGASSGSKHAIGTGVVGGMITATILAIFYILSSIC